MNATIQREAKESLLVTVVTDADPTGSVVKFCAVAAPDRPAGFVVGAWEDPIVQRRDTKWEARVRTPTCGATGADIELDVGIYNTYVLIESGSEEIILETGTLAVE